MIIIFSIMLSSRISRYIISSIPYIDKDMVGVMGTNYGGFLASLVLAQSSLVRCGVVTDLVVDWRNYGEFC